MMKAQATVKLQVREKPSFFMHLVSRMYLVGQFLAVHGSTEGTYIAYAVQKYA